MNKDVEIGTKAMVDLAVIKQKLIESCKSFDAFMFLPYLLSPVVRVNSPNKIRFYSSYKEILNSVKTRSVGILELIIEKESWEKDEDVLAYNFYDQVHEYPRINLQVKEKESCLFIDILPF